MSEVSGFDPLCAALERGRHETTCSVPVPAGDSRPISLVRRIKLRFFGGGGTSVPRSPSPFTAHRHEAVGALVLQLASRHPQAKIILSAAENQYGGILANAPSEVRRRLILCFHQPPSWMRLHWLNFEALSGLGGIVCLGSKQRAFFQTLTEAPVCQIRHGVMLDFFTPVVTTRQDARKRLLFVGQWLRDFRTLSEIMPLVWAAMPDVELDCVIPRFSREAPELLTLARDARVRWHADISPQELLALYHGASVLVLPLLDAVANNAILEALACGLPIVTSAVGDIADYLPADAGRACPAGDARAHAAAVTQLLADPAALAQAGRAGRAFAQHNLDWTTIAARLVGELSAIA